MKNPISIWLALTLFAGGYAHADPVRNPVYELKFNDLCKAEKKNGVYKRPGQMELGNPGFVTGTAPKGEYWQVKKSAIIRALEKRYPFKEPVTTVKLTDGDIAEIYRIIGSPNQANAKTEIDEVMKRRRRHLLAEKLAPCYEKDISTMRSEDLKGDAKKRLCGYDSLLTAPSKRFKDAEVLRFRHALLSLFKAAQTGAANNFAVIRSKVHKERIDHGRDRNKTLKANGQWRYAYFPVDIENGDDPQISGKEKSGDIFDYNPTDHPYIDDQMIGDFLTAETPPYAVFCKANAKTPVDPVAKEVIKGPITQSVPRENPELGKIYKKDSVHNAIDDSIPGDGQVNFITKLARTHTIRKSKDKKKDPQKTLTADMNLVATPADFINTKPAQIGFKAESGKDTVTIKGTSGFHFKHETKYNNGKSSTVSFIPFVSMDQDAVEITLPAPTEMDPAATRKENVAYADISVGARFEWGHERSRKFYDHDSNIRRRFNKSGLTEPGWRFGLTGEWFTDNYIEQMGWRIGADFSVPTILNLPGYRRDFHILWNKDQPESGADIKQQPLGQWHWGTGWSFKWKFDPALDYIYYNRAPLDFSTPFALDREDVKDYFAYGVNTGISFKKQGIFGLASDDAWLEFGVDYSHRRTDDIGTFDLTDLFVKITYPEIDNVSVGLDYEIGEILKSQKKRDSFKIVFGVKY